jgi:carbonic anhydrase/acetyltransferase-like protein (isoleucine patch superfamily)
MPIFEFENRVPIISENSYVSPSATIIGDVQLKGAVWVGPGAVIRGDYGTIVIGDGTAVEDNVVIHARPGKETNIGEHVTLGHSCVIHTATIRDFAVIGMHSTVTDYAEVGKWAVVAEHALVKTKQIIEPEMIAGGVPAKIIKEVTEEYKKMWTDYKFNYTSFCKRYKENLKIIE